MSEVGQRVDIRVAASGHVHRAWSGAYTEVSGFWELVWGTKTTFQLPPTSAHWHVSQGLWLSGGPQEFSLAFPFTVWSPWLQTASMGSWRGGGNCCTTPCCTPSQGRTPCVEVLTDTGDADWLSRVTSVQSSTTCGTDWCHCLSVQENSGMLGEAWLPSTGPDWKLSAGDVGSYLILSSLEFAVLARLTLNPQGSTSLSQVVELKIMPRYQLTFWDKVSLKLDFIGLSRPSVGQLPNNLQFVTHCGLWDLASTGFKF